MTDLEIVQLTFENQTEVKEWCNGHHWSMPPMRAITGIAIPQDGESVAVPFGHLIVRDKDGKFSTYSPDLLKENSELQYLVREMASWIEDRMKYSDVSFPDTISGRQLLSRAKTYKSRNWTESSKMPEYDGDYLCFIESKQTCGAVWKYQRLVTCKRNMWVTEDDEVVTHWMQLPPSPETSLLAKASSIK